ncbi:hypothetical protein BACCIP111895_03924 [Neobacillus rhizosphaerae]|uniref:ACT domain-containing protein n=1 Tax=Neobacillus rhizosphaerae TaxID=2880965 RepID=A0ABM9EVM4_9BACI|nr:hypothetical protein BACCIP111895_03924 [Neobacillus rhizosphaerae]
MIVFLDKPGELQRVLNSITTLDVNNVINHSSNNSFVSNLSNLFELNISCVMNSPL